jgi:hypothetical protein
VLMIGPLVCWGQVTAERSSSITVRMPRIEGLETAWRWRGAWGRRAYDGLAQTRERTA